jgi:arylsulfatase A-like enzyme/thioredoxin-like negative regulator of GroEL
MRVVLRFFVVLILTGAAATATLDNQVLGAERDTRQPNIILITLDTTRADRMGFLGSKRGLTPNLDILAAQSVIFTRAYAQVPLTTPSHGALLTGMYPQFTHMEDLGSPLTKDLPYLPDLLHGHGYHTAAFVGSEILDPASTAPGFQRGFDVYDADFHQRKAGEDRYKSIERRAEDVANRAFGWLSHNQQGPFFIWMHFYDAHDPYDPPEPFKTHFASAPYDGEIAYTDSVIGSILDVLQKHGLYQGAVIAVAADHGEAFGEHGEERHGMFLYDETIHVPLLLKLPGGEFGGTRLEERVALADVAPTLLEVAGIPSPREMQAQSLFPLFENPKSSSAGKSKEQPIYSETNYARRTFGWAELRSWRTGKFLYIQAPRRELYDQSKDPHALRNVARVSRAISDTLQAQLKDYLRETSTAQSTKTKLDPAQAEKLRALGYLAADSSVESGNRESQVDPKDKIAVANKFHRALVELEEDQYAKAAADLREVVRMEPEIGSGYLELGRALAHLDKYQEASQVLRIASEKNPDSGMTHYELGLLLIKTGQWEEALHEMQAAVDCTPNSVLIHFDLGAINSRLKHRPEAVAEYEKALELDPNDFETNLTYGQLLLLEGQPDAALAKLSRAVRVRPGSALAHRAMADAYEQLGQPENAERERAVADTLKANKVSE